MTPEEVRERVAAIAADADDSEAAHGNEDQLHQEVLDAIAQRRCDDPAELAAEALKTRYLKFQRWCA